MAETKLEAQDLTSKLEDISNSYGMEIRIEKARYWSTESKSTG